MLKHETVHFVKNLLAITKVYKSPMIIIRPYQKKDWQRICAIHDAARPDELRGSCDPRAFVPIEKDSEVEDLKRSNKYGGCGRRQGRRLCRRG